MGAVDTPSARRIHQKVTPRNGGLAVFLGVQCSLAIWFLVFGGDQYSSVISLRTWYVFLGASTLLVLVGVVDDIVGVRPVLKLSGQIIASAILLSQTELSVGQFLGIRLPGWAEFGVGLFWYLLLINSFNLIDGMDGLCGGLAAISCFGLALSFAIQGYAPDAVFSLALLGGCLGFLYYNFHPAKIFLGDNGSMFIGFCLATFTLPTAKSVALISLVTPLIVVGVPVFDTALAIWRRSMRSAIDRVMGEDKVRHIFEPDREHLHHRLLDTGLSQRTVARVLYGLSLALVVGLLLGDLIVDAKSSIYLVGIVGLFYVVVRHLVHIELWDTGLLLLEGMAWPKVRAFRPLLYLLWDAFTVAGALAGSYALLPGRFPVVAEGAGSEAMLLQVFLASLGPIILCLIVGGAYQRVWSRAGLFDFLALYSSLIVGTTLHLAAAHWIHGPLNTEDVARVMLFGGFVFVGVTTGRSVGQVTQLAILRSRLARKYAATGNPPRNVVLYGAGENALLLLKYQRLRDPRFSSGLKIIGFIDDDLSLRGRFVKGYRVFGGNEELEKVVKESSVDEVIVCQRLVDGRLEILRDLAIKHGFLISRWRFSLDSMEAIGVPKSKRD